MAAGGPIQGRVNWQERLEQGFQSRHAERLRNRGGQRQGQNEGIPMAAGPSAPAEGRVNWQGGSHDRNVQQSHNNRGGPLQDQNPTAGRFITPQQFMGRQERYAEDECQHTANLHNVQLQRQADHDMEALVHQAHLAELQRQREHQREMEVLQEQACLAKLQQLRHQEDLRHLAYLDELQ